MTPAGGSQHEASRGTGQDGGFGAELPPENEDESGQEKGEKGREEGQGLTSWLSNAGVGMYIIPKHNVSQAF